MSDHQNSSSLAATGTEVTADAVLSSVTVKSGEVLNLDNTRIEGVLTLNAGGVLEGEGVIFASSARLHLSGWSGSTTAALSGLRQVGTESKYLTITLSSFTGDGLLAGFAGVDVQYALNFALPAGCTFTLGEGASLTSWYGGRIKGTLVCRDGAVLDSVIADSGGVLQLHNTRVDGTLTLYGGSALEGDGARFEDDISLSGWSGDTATAFAGLRNISCDGSYLLIRMNAPVGDCVLSAVSGLNTHYLFESYIPTGRTITVGSGTTFALSSGCTLKGVLDCQEGSTLENVTVASGGVLKLNDTKVRDIILQPGARMEGSHVAFTSRYYPLRLEDWSGSTADALSGLSNITSDAGFGINVKIAGDCTLSALPGMKVPYYLGSSISTGHTVTLESGASLGLLYGNTIHGSLHCQAGSRLLSSKTVLAEGGQIQLTEVTLEETTILYQGGNLCLEACRGTGALTIESGDGSGLSLHGNDFSQIKVDVSGILAAGGRVDLSGNYWGTTDEDAIKAAIVGYDAAGVTLGTVLTYAPVQPNVKDEIAPLLSLQEPQMQVVSSGLTHVTFHWETNEAGTCKLTVDGKTYAVSGNSHTLALRDGDHSYSVTVTDAAGNSTTQEGKEFTLDATAPVLTLEEPQSKAAGEGFLLVTFTWQSSETAIYKLTIDGEEYTVTQPRYEILLRGGTHSYSVTATDAAGNSTVQEGKAFTLVVPGPELTLLAPKISNKEGEGRALVFFRWKTDATAISCQLTVDGETYSTDQSSIGLSLTDGLHHYSLTVTDKFGNSTTVDGESFTLDATSPVLTLDAPHIDSLDDGRIRVTFRWQIDDDNAICELMVDEKTYAVSGNSHTLELAAGWHHYAITATDSSGNSSSKSGEFSHTPLFTLHTPEFRRGRGKTTVSLSWRSLKEEASYVLQINGRRYTLGKKTSWKGSLADGDYSYTLYATDSSGNQSQRSGSLHCDATAPTVTLAAPHIKKTTHGYANVTLSWQGSEAATYSVVVDNKVVWTGTQQSCSLELRDGKHTWAITATDVYGNVSKPKKSKFTCDTTPPVVSLKVPKVRRASRTIEGRGKVTLSWKGESRATYTLSVNGRTMSSGTRKSATLELADGEYEYTLTATDAAGNSSTTTSRFTVDTTAPVLNLAKPEGSVKASTVSFRWTGEAGASYSLKVGRESFTATGAGTHTHRFTLKDGKYSYTLTAVDSAGNKVKEKGRFIIDTTAPVLTLGKAVTTRFTPDGLEAVLHWKSERGASYVLEVDGAAVYSGTATRCALSLAAGEHQLILSASDAAGNSRQLSSSLWVDGDSGRITLTEQASAAGLDRELALSSGALSAWVGGLSGASGIESSSPGADAASQSNSRQQTLIASAPL